METAFRTRYGHFEYQVMPFPTSVSADIRFMSEGLTRMQTTKRVELFSAKECTTVAQGTMIKGLCGLVLEVKIVPITISAEYSDHTDILASTIIPLIWPSKSPVGASNIVHPQEGR